MKTKNTPKASINAFIAKIIRDKYNVAFYKKIMFLQKKKNMPVR